MTKIDLDELERIGKDAIAGPWESDASNNGSRRDPHHFVVIANDMTILDCLNSELAEIHEDHDPDDGSTYVWDEIGRKNVAFVCAARNNWQAMIDELRQHREFRAAMSPAWRPNSYGEPCGCQKCMRERDDPNYRRFMHVCPNCGNKRCPHCEFHGFKCTGSNATGQVGELIQSTSS